MANKYLNYDGVAYLWEKIKAALSGKVDVESGKGLSSNDYTSTEKTKLANIASGAQVNVLEGVQVNGSSLTPTNKIVNVAVPTKTSDITNDSGFITAADVPEGAVATTTTPKMDGTAAVGSEVKFARGDHVHPSDTTKVDKETGKGLSSNDYTSTEKDKLAAIASGAEVNQNAFSNVKVGSTTIASGAKTATLELYAGSNVSLTPDSSNKKVTIAATDTTYDNVVAGGASGLMSGSDKTKLDGIASGAQVNSITGVKGSAESSYRTGDVSISAANVGAIATSARGAANGVCPLDANSKVDSSYLPSYVDDIIEAYPRSGATELSSSWLSLTSGGAALTPETGKIYILMAASTSYPVNAQFRWSGSTYVKLSDGDMVAITTAEIDTITAA